MGVLGGVLGPIIEGGAGLFDRGGGIMGVGGGGGVKGGRGGGGHGEVGEEEDGGDVTLAFANVMKMKQIATKRSWSNLCHTITDEFSFKSILI